MIDALLSSMDYYHFIFASQIIDNAIYQIFERLC